MNVDNFRNCTFYMLKRNCTNENCKFKHESNPNLEYKIRTVLCKYYTSGYCNRGSACTFAHGEGNLVIPRQPRIISQPTSIELSYLESDTLKAVNLSPHEWLNPTIPIESNTSQNVPLQQSHITHEDEIKSETSDKFINSEEIIEYKYTIDKVIKKQNESDIKIKILELELNTLKEMMKYKELQFQEITNDLLKQIKHITR